MPNEESEFHSDELWCESLMADGAGASVPPDADAGVGQQEPPVEEEEEFDIEPYLPRIEERLRETLLPKFREEAAAEVMKRTRQSLEARDKAIAAQLQPLNEVLEKLVQQGVLSEQERTAELFRRVQMAAMGYDQAQAQREAEAQIAAIRQQQMSADQPQPEWVVSTERQFEQILQNSGLAADDPELAIVPKEITNPDPYKAVAEFKAAVETAARAKQVRLGEANGGNGATQPAARARVPFIDMGTGAGAGKPNPIANIEDPDELWRASGKW